MNRKLHAALALVAVVSFGLYILGCVGYAAWNADSTKLLVPYYSPDARECGVVLYDLKAHTSKKLMTQGGVDNGEVSMQAQWVKGATQPFVLLTGNGRKGQRKHLSAFLFPTRNGATIRTWLLPNPDDTFTTGPFAELNNKVFIPSSYLEAINVQDGTLEVSDYEEKEEQILALATDGKRLFYVRGAKRPAPTPDTPDRTESGAQFGEVNLTDLKRIPFFEVFDSELEAQGLEFKGTDLVFENGGTRLAMNAKHDNSSAIMVFNSARLERTVFPKLPAKDCRLGAFTWPRPDSILAIAACPAGEDIAQISLAEMDVSDGTVRLTPVFRVNVTSSFWDEFDQYLKPSLAPNGRVLAIITTTLDDRDVTPDDRALFLVDLKSPERRVTRIAIPGVTKAVVH